MLVLRRSGPPSAMTADEYYLTPESVANPDCSIAGPPEVGVLTGDAENATKPGIY